MSKQWKRLSNMLHTAEGRDFERAALPFIRAIWAEAIVPQPLRSTYDQSGVDILVWSGVDTLAIALAVQCKGFTVKENELGRDQIRQCIASIKTFRESEIKADVYLLLHNRIPNNQEFRAEVQLEADTLKETGQVKEVHVWGAQKLLQEATKSVRDRCIRILQLNESKTAGYVLKDKDTPVILILDALDESIYFSRPGGLQQLFNQLRDIRVPVILLARSEFWEGKQSDFANSYGLRTETQSKIVNRKVRMIRL